MNDASYCHAGYDSRREEWRMVRAACEGERAVKRIPNTLPFINPGDPSEENIARNLNYVQRAVFFNATGRTRDGLIGLAFAKDPDVNFGPFKHLEDNADGLGTSIYHAAQQGLAGVLETGGHGFLTDFVNDEPAIVGYSSERIINWRIMTQGTKRTLTLLVLQETVQVDDTNDWSSDYVEQYRVYRLVNGKVQIEIHRERGGAPPNANAAQLATSKEIVMHQQPAILQPSASNREFTEIPFSYAGAKTNSMVELDTAPLLGLADMNYAHYRDSADYQDSVFFCGQVQSYMTGLSEEWRDRMLEEGVYVGSRKVLLLPVGGTFGFAQAQPNTLAKEAMDGKRELMVALGARVVEEGKITKTATQAAGDIATGTSVLGLCSGNVSEAITRSLQWCGNFANAKPFDAAKFAITQKFDEQTLDPDKLRAIVEAWQNGALPTTDMRIYMKRVGVIAPERTDAELDSELDAAAKDDLAALAQQTKITSPPPPAPTGPNNGPPQPKPKTPSPN